MTIRSRSGGRSAAWPGADRQLKAVARHEAAHVVVSMLGGCVVQCATIDPAHPQLSAGRRGAVVVTGGSFMAQLVGIVAGWRYDAMCGWYPPRRSYASDRSSAAAVALILTDPRLGPPLVDALLADREIDPKSAFLTVLARAEQEADRLLSLPDTQRRIDAVAAALLASGTLQRRRIDRLVGSDLVRVAL